MYHAWHLIPDPKRLIRLESVVSIQAIVSQGDDIRDDTDDDANVVFTCIIFWRYSGISRCRIIEKLNNYKDSEDNAILTT
jgi:hypothetical protein